MSLARSIYRVLRYHMLIFFISLVQINRANKSFASFVCIQPLKWVMIFMTCLIYPCIYFVMISNESTNWVVLVFLSHDLIYVYFIFWWVAFLSFGLLLTCNFSLWLVVNSGSTLVMENVIKTLIGNSASVLWISESKQFWAEHECNKFGSFIYQPTFPIFNLQAFLRSACFVFTVEKSKFCLQFCPWQFFVLSNSLWWVSIVKYCILYMLLSVKNSLPANI